MMNSTILLPFNAPRLAAGFRGEAGALGACLPTGFGRWWGRHSAELHLKLGALSGCGFAPARLAMKFVGSVLKAPRSPNATLLKPRQKSGSVLSILFRPLLSFVALVHSKDRNEGSVRCPAKEFPKTEKEFPRTT